MKLVFLIPILLFAANLSYSQVSGYMGKKFILQTEVFTSLFEGGYDGGMEAVVLRNLSLYSEYNFRNKYYTQKLEPYYTRFTKYPDDLGNIKNKNLSIGIKWYQNPAYTAPYGIYLFFQYGYGRAEMHGNYYLIKDNNDSDLDEYYRYTIYNARTRQIDYGFGSQKIYKKFFTVDFRFGITTTRINIGQENEYLIEDMAGRHGPNFLNWGNIIGKQNPGGVGLSARVKLGILLF
jgi:hypothetical protein